jgi:multiple sugar transport system substrate-binding protein
MNYKKLLSAGTVLGVACVALLTGEAFACSPDYTGVTLNVGSQTGPFIASALQAAAKTWTEKTCGQVKVIEFPFGELYPKYVTALQAGEKSFDIMTFPPAWTPDLAPFLQEMPAAMRQTDAWKDIHPNYRERLMVWDGKTMTQSIDGDLHNLSYRIDLFEDPKEKEAFKKKYGYDLAVPATWKQYYDIAEFFTRPDKGLYGTVEPFRRGGQQFWFFFTHAATYANSPNDPGAMFFNPETMDAEVNNPGWVKALEDYVRSVKYSPAGALNYGYGDVNTAFAGGQAAMALGWGDTGVIAGDKKQSKIAGNVGSAMAPASDQIYNAKTKAWDKFDKPVPTPFMAFGGWQAGINANGDHKDAAWNYIEWVSNPENSGKAVVTGGSGVNPYRFSHMSDLKPWETIFTEREAKEYLASQLDSLNAKNVAYDMRLPGYFSYTEILEIELGKALNGDETPQQALDSVAQQWNKLTDDLGRDKQLVAYRNSMGLPAK